MSESTRGWIYRVATALGALAIFYGAATEAEVALWIGLVTTTLGSGLASVNTKVTRGRHSAKRDDTSA